MDNAIHLMGEHATTCADFSVRAEVAAKPDDADSPQFGRIDLNAVGPDDNGSVSLRSNGRVAAKVEQCSLDVVESGIVADAGDSGNIGLRAGSAPMMQHVELQGNGGSILLQNGQIDLSPKIEIGADSIELSVGTNKITIGATGISISGLMVAIEGITTAEVKGAEVSLQGSIGATVKGTATVELSASGMATVKGGIVMIN